MGAAGDMITGSLLELVDNKSDFLKKINSIGLSDIKIIMETVKKCGIVGTHIRVNIHGSEEMPLYEKAKKYNYASYRDCNHKYTNLYKIENIITNLNISKQVKKNALNIYQLIAEAEANIHGKTIEQIHFHEIGNLDAIVDIVSTCILIEIISPQKIIISPINIGSGFVHCMHGTLAVPAPATAFILKNIPIFSNNIKGELCTPTGAAILKYFATHFQLMPKMQIQKIGYGMGAKNFDAPNCVRAFLGKTINSHIKTNECIVQLQCNLDDMTGEAVGFAIDILSQKGALDVFITSIQMKKNRPGILLTCICNENKSDFFAELILRYTSTFGVRKTICKRYTLKRKTIIHETAYGKIQIKMAEGYNIKKSKPEYDDVAKVAVINNIPFHEIVNNLKGNK